MFGWDWYFDYLNYIGSHFKRWINVLVSLHGLWITRHLNGYKLVYLRIPSVLTWIITKEHPVSATQQPALPVSFGQSHFSSIFDFSLSIPHRLIYVLSQLVESLLLVTVRLVFILRSKPGLMHVKFLISLSRLGRICNHKSTGIIRRLLLRSYYFTSFVKYFAAVSLPYLNHILASFRVTNNRTVHLGCVSRWVLLSFVHVTIWILHI